ncbi:uncharacterized protein LOC116773844 [Danaus plexippus]|uniref:uncharacterized protein LOC116773844 n=1 Tax=Danaus plexippus TaxID=13037 RepID=UPI002AB236D1|nr:uncharacterized protein LOC116773844 [Danaus plexippus]
MSTLTLTRFAKSSELIENAASIANDIYKPHLSTAVAWWNNDHEHVNEFLFKYLGVVTVLRVKYCRESCLESFKVKQTVFFADSPREFQNFLSVSNNFTFEAILVILVINEFPVSDLSEYSKIALKKDVEDIVIVSLKIDGTIAVSTVIPYGSGSCGDYTPRVLTTGERNYFKENKYRNFYGCPIRVTALELVPYVKVIKENDTVINIDGLDADFVKLVIKSLNATLKIVSASDHGDLGYYINGTATGTFGDLYYNVADIVVPALLLTTRRYPAAQVTYVHRPTRIILCLPKQEEIYKLLKVLLPFYNWLTPMVIAVAISIYLTIKFVKIFGPRGYEVPQRIAFGIFSLFFGQFYNVNSKYWYINTMLILWIWFCMVFRISYEGRLVEGLHHVILEPPVETYDEAINVIKEARIHPTFMDFYRNTSLEKKAVEITLPDLETTFFAIASGEKYLLAIDMEQARVYKKTVQILERKIVDIPVNNYLRPRWPAAKFVATVILRSIDSGQMIKIMDDFSSGWQLKNSNNTVALRVRALGMDLLGSCFLCLIVMYAVCCLIFLVEIYIVRRNTIFLPFIN